MDTLTPKLGFIQWGPETPLPGEVFGLTQAGPQIDLFGEQVIVIVHIIAKELEGFDKTSPACNDFRPPSERRSGVANSSKTRTGSAVESTVVVLVRRCGFVVCTTAARTTSSADAAKRKRSWYHSLATIGPLVWDV